MTMVKIKQTGWTVVPADVYLAKVKKIEELDLEFGHSVKIAFEIADGDYAGDVVDGLASMPVDGISPKSKLYGWLLAILGNLDEVEEADLDSLIGRKCRINVVEKKKDDGSVFNRIEAVLPAPRSKKPAPQPAEDTEDF